MKNFYLLIVLLPFLSSCQKEVCCKGENTHTYIYLTPQQIAKTPYFTNPAFDTLTFISNANDTLIFAKLKTDTFYHKTSRSDCPDCPVHYSYYQELHKTYQTIKGNGKFEVRHVSNGRSSVVIGEASNFIEINFNNSKYFFYDYWIGSKTYPTFNESLSINNKTYNNTITKYLNINFNDTINSNFILINQEYGIFYKRIKSPFIEMYLIK